MDIRKDDRNQIYAALGVGLLFGGGLTISGMINPAKILAFLDVSGNWDPSLIVVMCTALLVAAIGYRIVFARPSPLFAEKFLLPTRKDIDGRLVSGAALFGVGWGLSGLCPGPAISVAALAPLNAATFLIALAAGIVAYRYADAWMTSTKATVSNPLSSGVPAGNNQGNQIPSGAAHATSTEPRPSTNEKGRGEPRPSEKP